MVQTDGRRKRVEDEVKTDSEGGGGRRQRQACFSVLFPSRTNAGRHRPRSCDFEVVSLIKELIKEKLHASEQIT